ANYAFSGLELLGDSHVRLGEFEPPWHEYAKMIGGVWIQGPPKTAHGDRHSFKVRYIDREHPVAAGLEETFIATDELYHNVQMEPAARVLATAFSDPATRGTGRDEPVLWSVDYGKGRVFYTALGHDLTAMCEPGFAVSFVRGCEWASKGEVALEPGTILDERREEKVKALLVTGGHGFDTEFYGVFDLDRLAWDHAFTPSEAYKSDFRDKYDVLVLYDLTHEIDDNGKKNLRAFVESGKGLVVLHHAIADYNSWPWWWREVVGGKYLMEPDGEMPASTYIHDLELFLRPVGEHSITAGLGPMHIQDETYKGMWISPEVKVIMETDEETSDGPVAWISPYEKSRVVYVQLGHDRKAHVHPGYRKLVQRAILWAAGRLE
ncbi:MAG: ThuA domain-containing protein, partial [Gemmatimonadota bacterium]|nr:ThuA domain-containing protein [Gemmatimonadota bacterium]